MIYKQTTIKMFSLTFTDIFSQSQKIIILKVKKRGFAVHNLKLLIFFDLSFYYNTGKTHTHGSSSSSFFSTAISWWHVCWLALWSTVNGSLCASTILSEQTGTRTRRWISAFQQCSTNSCFSLKSLFVYYFYSLIFFAFLFSECPFPPCKHGRAETNSNRSHHWIHRAP